MNENLTRELQIVENSVEVLRSAPEILRANMERSAKAYNIGQMILVEIDQNGGKLNDDLFEGCKRYILNCATAKQQMNEARKPITQIVDLISSKFTAAENDLDVKKPHTPAYAIQAKQDAYVRELKAEADRKKKEEEAKIAKEKELAVMHARITESLNNYVTSLIIEKKRKMSSFFDGITMDTFDAKSETVRNAPLEWIDAGFPQWNQVFSGIYLKAEEVSGIKSKIEVELQEALIHLYNTEVKLHQKSLIDQLPTKKAELEEMAKANAAEKERLEQAAEQRRKEAEDRLKQEQAQKEEDARKQADLQKAQAETEAMFNSQAAITSDQPKVKEKVVAVPLNMQAYALFFQLWFSEEGSKMEMDKAKTMSLERMNNYATKAANRKDKPVKIESPYIKYEEEIKAVNK